MRSRPIACWRSVSRARAPGEPSYPFHIGVTEAGDAEDGRIKSAIGIGALLEDGIGDTVRVSLTESPVAELPVAAALVERARERWGLASPPAATGRAAAVGERRPARALGPADYEIGGEHPVRVEVDLGPVPAEARARDLAASLAGLRDVACEGVHVEVYDPTTGDAVRGFRKALGESGVDAPLAVRAEAGVAGLLSEVCDRLVVPVGALVPDAELAATAAAAVAGGAAVEWELRGSPADVPAALARALAAAADAGLQDCLFSIASELPIHANRVLAVELAARQSDAPVVLHHRGSDDSSDRSIVAAAVDLGAPLCDGIGDAVVAGRFRGRPRARRRARLPHPPGSAAAHVLDGVHLAVPRAAARSSTSRRPPRASSSARSTCARREDRHHGLHRERPRRDGRRRLRLRRLGPGSR